METKDKTNARTLATLTFSLLAFSIVSFSSFAAFAAAQDVEIPTLTPYVTDFAGVIEPQYKNAINDYASKLEAATTDEVAVLTVRSTQPMSIEEYAVRVFEKNGIGQKGKDNGVLVVVAVDDRQWKIEVGYGLEGDINDAKAGRIGRTYMTEYFREEKYGEGLYLTVKTLGDIIAGNTTLSGQFEETPLDFSILWIFFTPFILVLIFIFAIAAAFAIKKRRCPKCGGWMKVEYEKDKVCYVCKKCGYKKCEKRKRHAPFFVFVGGGSGWGSGGGGGGGFGGGGSGGGGASGGY
jgi:uncharacterized protein